MSKCALLIVWFNEKKLFEFSFFQNFILLSFEHVIKKLSFFIYKFAIVSLCASDIFWINTKFESYIWIDLSLDTDIILPKGKINI